MKKSILLLLAVAAISCSPQKKLNRKIERAEKFARKHALMIVDTIVIHDTTIIESHFSDTVTHFIHNDTVTVINNERVKVKYYYDSVTNNIHHWDEVKEVEVIKEIPVIVEKVKHVKSNSWATLFVLCLVLFFVGLISYKLSKSNTVEK